MFDDFVIRALLAGVGVALVASMLGCFVVWRRMAYFGDSLAHSALLGIALGLVTGMSFNLGIVIICSGFATLLLWLQQQQLLANDTLLGILAHSSLSIGMVVISFLGNTGFNLHTYLFGDILTVEAGDIYWIYGGGAVVLILLMIHWTSLTLMTVSEDLAVAEGVNTFYTNLVLVGLMTLVVSVSIRIVGILLVTSLLIIPAACARQWARSPESMALLSAIAGVLSVVAGIYASLYLDTPSGPSIVSAAALLFILSVLSTRLTHK